MGRKARARRSSETVAPKRLEPSVVDIWALRLTVALAVFLSAAMIVSVLFPIPGLHERWKLALLGAAEVFILLRAYLAIRTQSWIEAAMWIAVFAIILLSL